MKKFILIAAAALLLPALAHSQTKPFRNFYDKYAGKEGYSTIEMSGAMLKAMSSSGKDDGGNTLEGLKNMIIITSENPGKEFRADIKALSRSDCYSPLTVIRDGSDTVELLIAEENSKVKEFLIVILDSSDAVVMSFTGDNLNINGISQIAKQVTDIDDIILED